MGYRPDQNIAWNEQTAIQLLYKFRLKQPQSNPFVLTAWTDFLKKDGFAFQDFFQIYF